MREVRDQLQREMEIRFAEVNQRFDAVNQRFARMERRLLFVGGGIFGLLTTLVVRAFI